MPPLSACVPNYSHFDSDCDCVFPVQGTPFPHFLCSATMKHSRFPHPRLGSPLGHFRGIKALLVYGRGRPGLGCQTLAGRCRRGSLCCRIPVPQLCSLSGVAEAAVPHLSPSQVRPQGPFPVGCSAHHNTRGACLDRRPGRAHVCVYLLSVYLSVCLSLCLCICFSVSLCVSAYMCVYF